MTMKQIKGLVSDWRKTLESRSVWAVLIDGRKRRITDVGRKYVWISEDAKHKRIEPGIIYMIDGL